MEILAVCIFIILVLFSIVVIGFGVFIFQDGIDFGSWIISPLGIFLILFIILIWIGGIGYFVYDGQHPCIKSHQEWQDGYTTWITTGKVMVPMYVQGSYTTVCDQRK